MQLQHIAGYKFTELDNLESIKDDFLTMCQQSNLKGTILLSAEGINLGLSGTEAAIEAFKLFLETTPHFGGMTFHHSVVNAIPYQRLKVKIKKEIVTMRQGDTAPLHDKRAPALAPLALKQWLDENRDFILLDTRNDYEYSLGTFKGARNLHLDNFCELPDKVQDIAKDQTIVMFCTGGIRCEKAAIYMQQQGYSQVYQLDGGILGYFKEAGAAHYEGGCFVFDEREVVHPV